MLELEKSISVDCPAKINLFLFIQKKRDDGYHELLMDLIPVSLFDRLEFLPPQKSGIHLTSNLNNVNPEDNLVIKAARILEVQSNQKFSLKINLNKNIPWGAGLGGGSSDAGVTLTTLNRLYQLNFTDRQLKDMALKLGADVPFFLQPQPSLAEGIGEKLTLLPVFTPLFLILIFPNFPISTHTAYTECRISKRKNVISEYSTANLSRYNAETNDFWIPLSRQYPELEQCRSNLINENAIFAGMSGSGSTIFGVFKNKQLRNRAYKNLRSNTDWRIIHCETLN